MIFKVGLTLAVLFSCAAAESPLAAKHRERAREIFQEAIEIRSTHDVGTTLNHYFQNPEELRAQLIAEWPGKCERQISTPGPVKSSSRARVTSPCTSFIRTVI